LIDFGLSAVKEFTPSEIQQNEKKMVFGTPKYMAPEVWLGHEPNEKSDIYAFALVMWEIFVREPRGPYSQYSSFKVMHLSQLDLNTIGRGGEESEISGDA